MKRLQTVLFSATLLLLSGGLTEAQLAPEIGYMFPSGARAGDAVEVTLGGYDWTPDMQLFVDDPRIQLELLGPPTAVLMPDPPYWFGAKGRGPAWPLPREFRARLTVASDMPPGLVRWQVANANGVSPPATFHIGDTAEVRETESQDVPQQLPSLPVLVSGQIRKIEEVDRYQFQVPADGPVTVELVARRIGSPLHGMLRIQDSTGNQVVDVADTEGRDLRVTFAARADECYKLELHDLDFAGDRSYVYRLQLTPGPQVLAAFPAAGRRGETRSVQFVGIGVETGQPRLESVARDVSFPADETHGGSPSPLETGSPASEFTYVLETPHGSAQPYTFLLSDWVEHVQPPGTREMELSELPCAVTAAIETPFGTDEYTITLKKDERWQVTATATSTWMPLDLELSVVDSEGKLLASQDDSPTSTDPTISFTAPADGDYRISATDRSVHSGSRASAYRLLVREEREDYSLSVPTQLSVTLEGAIKLPVKLTRAGGFAGAVAISLGGLPAGVTVPDELTIPAGKNDLSIDVTCAADAVVDAVRVTVTGAADLTDVPVSRSAQPMLLATVMKPRIKITPEGLDDVRTVHRGSTFLAPLLIERLEEFDGEIVLEMTAKQQRHRQGLASHELVVPLGPTRIEYPIFVPEWMETTKTSRMILNGVVQVPDPQGNVRTLVQKMALRIGVLPQGALMKLAHDAGELSARPGDDVRIALTLSRAADFHEPVRIELVSDPPSPADSAALPITAPALEWSAEQERGEIIVSLPAGPQMAGDVGVKLRATALKDGHAVVSETEVTVRIISP